MSIESPGELLTALARKEYDAILGTPESDDLDFKEYPYRLDDDKGKWELSKDVAAMANTNGGCLVIGYSVRRGPTDVAEVADELRPVPVELINPDQYKKVLSAHVFPPPTVTFHPFTADLPAGRQVFVIEVGTDKSHEPFLVRRMPQEGGKVTSEAIGIPSRFHDDTLWESAERVHQRISASSTVRTHVPKSEAADRPKSTHVIARAKEQSAAFEVRSKARMRQIGELQEWESEPSYSIFALPATLDQELDDLHDPSGLGGLIEHPESLRRMGFGLVTGTTEVIDGGLVGRSSRGPTVWLESDGFFTAQAQATREFLAWAVNDGVMPQRTWTLINSLVLVEFTLEFFRLAHSALVPRIRGPWHYAIRCHGFQSSQLRLAPDFPTSVVGYWEENTHAASSDDWWKSFIDADENPPGRNASQALRYVYQLFGLPPSAIPFAKDSAISEELIRGA